VKWSELLEHLERVRETAPSKLEDSVYVYDADNGEFLPADIIVFDNADDIIDKSQEFICVNFERFENE
jgi:hypothetical protein